MENEFYSDSDAELINERYSLALERIGQIAGEVSDGTDVFQEFFGKSAGFILRILEIAGETEKLVTEKNVSELSKINRELYSDILPENYGKSYGSYEYCAGLFGTEYGTLLCFLYSQLRRIIPLCFEKRTEEMLIYLEIFLLVYQNITSGAQLKEIKDNLYYFVSDYAELTVAERVRSLVDPSCDFAFRIINNADMKEPAVLYSFGEYVSDNEIRVFEYLAGLPDEKIGLMAEIFVDGYVRGFELTGKDLSIKKSANLRFNIGFIRVIKKCMELLKKLGLESVMYRKAVHLLDGSAINYNGFMGAIANRQYDYDHREDLALFLDKALNDRRKELLKQSFEEYKQLAAVHAGPLVMETFGENPFSPEKAVFTPEYDEKQQKLVLDYAGKAGAITNEYIKGEERSFSIIAWPIPEIGDDFKRIFDETISINTLDYVSYRDMQQILIDTMDRAAYVHIKGKGDNQTDLRVALRKIVDIGKETQFENCVADVNIPVGEVFTSPVLEGTNGRLCVSKVFLNGFEFKKLSIGFSDGYVTDYDCESPYSNMDAKSYIKDNILMKHDTLPIGEFAIGTNTAAYAMGKKYDIFDRLPILIAEKTGPHFAVGDTCYSHAEDIKVYNPDGKEIISRDNSRSVLRKTEPEKAYFNCHTDITIPYDEIGELYCEYADGSSVMLIKNGKFVLDGLSALNLPLTNAV